MVAFGGVWLFYISAAWNVVKYELRRSGGGQDDVLPGIYLETLEMFLQLHLSMKKKSNF
jgi:hypothetical protein